MQLNHISIDGFGVLSNLEIRNIDSGLNVLYGSNGAGKTTILHFLRGMVCNFNEARKMRLLPPLKGGHPGGSIEVADGPTRYELIRHARPGHHDTLAIKSNPGDALSATQIREQLAKLDRNVLQTIFFVSGPEAHSIDEMVGLALRDGIELRTRQRQTTWIAERIDAIELERKDLFGPNPSRTNIDQLEQRTRSIEQEIRHLSHQQASRDSNWHADLALTTSQFSEHRREADWLHSELQSVQADLTEVCDRLWSWRAETISEPERIEPSQAESTTSWIAEIEEIDRQIAHAQQVLRDLASSRMQLSLESASRTGVDSPDLEVGFERQRSSLIAIEEQAQKIKLALEVNEQAQLDSVCVCTRLQDQLEGVVKTVQQHLALLCQELSRQQTASEQRRLLANREGVDRCEVELTRQIQRLRLRRDELVHASERTIAQQIQFRTRHAVEHCTCVGHETLVASQSESGHARQQETVMVCKTVHLSNARPGDVELCERLGQRKLELQRQWWQAQQRVCAAQTKLNSLQQATADFAADQTLLNLRQELVLVEQQLADAREQWQSLAVLQTVLQRTQKKLEVETVSPVLKEASELFQRMTRGRYLEFRFNTQAEELSVVNDAAAELSVHALSRGTLEQAALCLRLALCSEYRRRGVDLPLILDEVLADSDEQRLSAAIETLVEYGSQDRQLIFLTCQEHLVQLFETAGVVIRELPGSKRRPVRVNRLPELETKSNSEVYSEQHSRLLDNLALADDEPLEVGFLSRTQPDEPFWLQTESAVGHLPSLGTQMARRIGSIGVRTVSDLIELDPENTEIPLDSLQISAATLRAWQAESRLLCCVPGLTGRDAQLLVACDIFSPSELAQADADDLYLRVRRIRESHREYGALSWLSAEFDWPQRRHFVKWIQSAQRARSYRQAREWSTRRERRDGAHPTPTGHISSQASGRGKIAADRSQRGTATTGSVGQTTERTRTVALSSSETQEPAVKELRYFLNLGSPLVDAPSIGTKTAARFKQIGVMTVSDFINRDASELCRRIKGQRLSKTVIREWQQQAVLVCRIPELRGHDAQVLVACGFTEVTDIAAASPQTLYAVIGPFVQSNKGQRLLRSAKTPDLAEVADWIQFARQSRALKAA